MCGMWHPIRASHKYHSACICARTKFAGVVVTHLRCRTSPPPHESSQAGYNYSSVRSKVSSEPDKGGGAGRDEA